MLAIILILQAATPSHTPEELAVFGARATWNFCTEDRAKAWANSNEPADTVVRAAIGACPSEKRRLREAMVTNIRSWGLKGDPEPHADDFIAQVEKAQRDALLIKVMEARSAR